MSIWRIDLGYDGSGFSGYARQQGLRTVQEELETALFRHTGPVTTEVAGRTDRGVHATGQVVSFATDVPIEPRRLARSLNRQLAPEIAVGRVSPAPEGFSARFSATARTYHYLVLNREAPDPFLARTSLHVETPLDVAAMNAACRSFIGTRDFAALCKKSANRSTVRNVRAAAWTERGDDVLRYEVVAGSFCHQMVRSMVAIAVDVGRGKIPVSFAEEAIMAMERGRGRGAAPPHGLTLVSVDYD